MGGIHLHPSPATAITSFRWRVTPAVLDGFVSAFREAQAELNLFNSSHCDDMTGQELEGKVLVMSPMTLRESYWAPENQLWLATGGFGCAPSAAGRAVYATCLGDGGANPVEPE